MDTERTTSVCAMMIRPDGQRHFCSHKGALYNFYIGDIDLSVLDGARVASIGGMYGLPSFDGPGATEFFRRLLSGAFSPWRIQITK